MTTIYETYLKKKEEFDEWFVPQNIKNYRDEIMIDKLGIPMIPSEIKDFLRQSFIAMVEGEIAVLKESYAKGIKKVEEKEDRDIIYNRLNENLTSGYNHAIADQISRLESELEQLKNNK